MKKRIEKQCSKRNIQQNRLDENVLFENRIWMNSGEAADYLRIIPNNLRLKVFRRQIKAYKLGTRLMFKRTELDEHIKPLTEGGLYGY